MRNDDLIVEVPAKMLYQLAALADGYTMSGGSFISKSVISEANTLLYEQGYETFGDEPLFQLDY